MRLSEWIPSGIFGPWGSFFGSNCWKFEDDSKTAIKNAENVFSFSGSCTWTGTGNLSVLLGEYS